MFTCKPSGADLVELQGVAKNLKAANEALAKANKAVEAAKKHLTEWLATNRKLDLNTLEIGEVVNIDGVALIEIGKRNSFDAQAFAIAEPALFEKFKKDFPMRKFRPLV